MATPTLAGGLKVVQGLRMMRAMSALSRKAVALFLAILVSCLNLHQAAAAFLPPASPGLPQADHQRAMPRLQAADCGSHDTGGCMHMDGCHLGAQCPHFTAFIQDARNWPSTGRGTPQPTRAPGCRPMVLAGSIYRPPWF